MPRNLIACLLLLIGPFVVQPTGGGVGGIAFAAAARRDALASEPIRIQTRHLALSFEPAAGALSLEVLDGLGGVTHRAELPGLVLGDIAQQGFQPVPAPAALTFRNPAFEISFEVVNERVIAATWSVRDSADRELELRLRSDDRTAYYGTGERFNALDQRGYVLPMISDDRYGNKGVGSHKPVPFFMSSHGFGVWVDEWAPGVFDLSGTERFGTRLRFVSRRLRVVFIGGPALTDVLSAFTGLAGRPRVPPPWAFGLWKSRDVHHDQDSVYADIERLRAHRIPASVLVLDSPWETGYNTFEVNREQFREPERMFARIDELGFALCLWLTPFINSSNVRDMRGITPVAANYAEAAAAGHLVRDAAGSVARSEWWKGVGGLIDFTDPAATAWWHAQLASTRDYGARCFKADDGEGNFVPDAVFHDGTPARHMKNRYAVLYAAALQDYIDQELGGDGVMITRSGYTGAQRFGFAWAADNRADFSFADGLPSVILAGQNAALSGISLWGSDIAGYAGTPSKELFLRWTQLGTFSPFMQLHMTSNLGPWDFDAETLDIFRDYARLRIELFPYLYDAVHEASERGIPIIRPMVLAFPDDAAAHRHVYQFLFGPDLLVAPVYQPGSARSVYLPAGAWYDYWTRARHDGPATIQVDAPLARIPLFIRAGAIVPRLPEGMDTLVPRHVGMAGELVTLDDRRVLQVWPGEVVGLETWDGIVARAERSGDRVVLRVASRSPRPLEVRLVCRREDGVAATGAEVSFDADRRTTVVRFERLGDAREVSWPATGTADACA